MTPENFCNWLQGYLDLADPGEIRAEQIEIIKDHLKIVKKLPPGSSETSEFWKNCGLEQVKLPEGVYC